MTSKFEIVPKVKPEEVEIFVEKLGSLLTTIEASAPAGWQEQVDQAQLLEYRKRLLTFSNDELVNVASSTTIWENPSHAQATMDVIEGMITPPIM